MICDTKSEISTDDDSDISHTENSSYHPLKGCKAYKREQYVKKGILAQTLVACAVMMSAASCGMPVGYSAILLPQLKAENGSIQIDDDIGSWIASIHSAATPFGSLLSGLLMDGCGRKVALQIASLPLVIGWAFIAFSQNHGVLLVGRLIAGISAGLTAAAGQVLIGEISEPHIRGILSTVPFASYSFGILLVYAMGSLLPWRLVAGLSTVLPVLSIVVFFFLPESPVWLIRKGRTEDTKNALTWLRGGDLFHAKKETDDLAQRVENEINNNQHNKATWRMMLQPEVLKPFIIINIFNLMQILSGTYLVVFYAVDIVSQVSGQHIGHFLSAVLTACVRFIFTLIATILLGLIGRRVLAIGSGIGTSLSALCLGFFLYFQQNCQSNGYFAALCILIYVATNTVGFFILPGVLLGELYPAKIRGLAGGLTFMSFNFALFGITKAFPFVKNVVGIHGVFWIFGASSLFASGFLYLMLPETKGQTLNEIEDYFQENNFLWVTRNKTNLNEKTDTESV